MIRFLEFSLLNLIDVFSLEQKLSKCFSLVDVLHFSCYCAYLLEIILLALSMLFFLGPLKGYNYIVELNPG